MLLLGIHGNKNISFIFYHLNKIIFYFSGIASDALGLQCAFAYNKFHETLTKNLSLQLHQNIGMNLHNLLQILKP